MKPENEPDHDQDEDLDIEFGEKTLLEIDEAGRAFRKVLMDDEGKEGIDQDSEDIKNLKKKEK